MQVDIPKHTRNTSELILGSDCNTRDRLKPSTLNKAHQEGKAMVLEGMSAEAMDQAATDLGNKFDE
jgi:hypothetical protein